MSDSPTSLNRECDVLARHLVGMSPDAAVLQRYASFHGGREVRGVDRALLAAARSGRIGTLVADAYGRRFRRAGELHRRMVHLLAVLECTPPYFERLDHPGVGGPVGAIAYLCVMGALDVFALIVGVVAFGPVQLIAGDGS